jgi:NSS family neurotransmitter:Na+ symporter
MTLDGAKDAVFNHYLSTDWSKINIFATDALQRVAAREVWVAAFGQIFFTLSLGFGIMITYASYLPKKTNIGINALITCVFNCCYSLIAGLTVFGVVGFMAKLQNLPFEEAIKGGPQLAFVIYPKAISLLPAYNNLFGIMFFLILCIAGLTSGVSLIEAFTCSLTDKFNFKRKNVVTAVCLTGFAGSLVFTTNGGLYLLDIADHFITHYGLIIGGLLECILIGWVLKASSVRTHLNKTGSSIFKLWEWSVKYFTPIVLICLVYFSITGDIEKNYEGYATSHLIFYGGGCLLFCFTIALTFTLFPWSKNKLSHEHKPEEDDLLV